MENHFCCNKMDYFVQNHCDIHDNQFECPDCIIYYDDYNSTYGIILHDGGQSFVEIDFCPWCGNRLMTAE